MARFCPTVTTQSTERMTASLRAIREACETDPRVAHAAVTLHIEGPYISSEDGPRGAHPRAHTRPPDLDEFRRLQDAAGGGSATSPWRPSCPGRSPSSSGLAAEGMVVSLGHHGASVENIRDAVAAGARALHAPGERGPRRPAAAPQLHLGAAGRGPADGGDHRRRAPPPPVRAEVHGARQGAGAGRAGQRRHRHRRTAAAGATPVPAGRPWRSRPRGASRWRTRRTWPGPACACTRGWPTRCASPARPWPRRSCWRRATPPGCSA